jgi:DNA-binding response OmpR family regulator
VRDGIPVGLTEKELHLLRYLYDRREQVVTRQELLNEVWHYVSATTRTIDVHLSTLRQKLEYDSRDPRHLITVRGRGYMFREAD